MRHPTATDLRGRRISLGPEQAAYHEAHQANRRNRRTSGDNSQNGIRDIESPERESAHDNERSDDQTIADKKPEHLVRVGLHQVSTNFVVGLPAFQFLNFRLQGGIVGSEFTRQKNVVRALLGIEILVIGLSWRMINDRRIKLLGHVRPSHRNETGSGRR